jgi:hypothetical protein
MNNKRTIMNATEEGIGVIGKSGEEEWRRRVAISEQL